MALYTISPKRMKYLFTILFAAIPMTYNFLKCNTLFDKRMDYSAENKEL